MTGSARHRTGLPATPGRRVGVAAVCVIASVCAVSGTATFQVSSFDAGLPQDGQWRNGFVLADMNADGHVDIVHGPARKGPAAPVVFLGDGEGQWTRWAASFPDISYAYGDVAVADFDADGHPDLALAMHRRGIVVLLGDPAGRFRASSAGLPWLDEGHENAFTSRCIEAIDWNNDGRTDLVSAWEGFERLALAGSGRAATMPGVAVFINNGDGTWYALDARGREVGAFGDSLALAHLDDDGSVDLVAASRRMDTTHIGALGRGAEGWDAISCADLPARSYITAVCTLPGATDRVVMGRLTHDGARFTSALDVLALGDGPGLLRTPLRTLDSAAAVTAMASGDIDGDGAADVVVGRDDGHIELVLAGAAGGWYEAATDVTLRGDGRCYSVAVDDLDRDGCVELVAGFARETQSLGAVTMGMAGSGSIRVWKLRLERSVAVASVDQPQPAAHDGALAALTGAEE